MVGPGIWRETLKNIKNYKCTVQGLAYGKKTEKTLKKRHTHFRTWNMLRKLTNEENEKYT